MPTPPERTPPTPVPSSSAPVEDVTLPPEPSVSDTAPHAPGPANERLPAQLPAPFGRYRLLKLVGEGGMGRVYLAHDSQLDRSVALKVPLFSPEDGPLLRERFYREARAAATVLHANVCPVYDVGEIDGVPYLTMAYIEGRPLAQFAALKPLAPKQAAFLVRKLALALAEAHKRGVIHRDLKPANVMINRQGEPVVMDFGLARRARGGDPRLTREGAFFGTPAYAPPEQISADPDSMGPACDVYSLGVILYELLAGRLPFTGDALLLMSRALLEEPPPPSRFRPDLDPELEGICLKAMAKKPEQRYASMAVFAGALQDYLRGKAVAAEPPPAPIPAADAVALEAPAGGALRPGGPRSGTRLGGGPPTRRAAGAPTEALPPPRARRKPKRGPGVPVWGWVAGGAGAALVAVLVLAVVVYRLAGYGTVRFEPGEAGDGAELRVDGEVRHWGEALRLRTGEHRLEVSASGYVTLREPFPVQRGDNPTRRVRLEREQTADNFGAVRIDPSEAGAAAELKVDGLAVRWGEALRLRAGEHQLEVAGGGYRATRQPFTVRAGGNEPVVVQLRREGAITGQGPVGLVRRFKVHDGSVRSVAVAADGTWAVSASGPPRPDKTLRLWRLADGQLTRPPLVGHTEQIDAVVLAPNDQFVISASRDKTVRYWDVGSGRQRPLPGELGWVVGLALSANGKSLLTGSWDKTMRLWDVTTGKEVRPPFRGHGAAVQSVAFSPGQHRALSGSHDKTMRFWDLDNGQELCRFEHPQAVHGVAFSPDGGRALSACLDGTVRLWDLKARRLVRPLAGRHDGGALGVAFLPDGRALSCGQDGAVRLWDVERGTELHAFKEHAGPVWGVAVFAGGRRALSASGDGTVCLWRLSP